MTLRLVILLCLLSALLSAVVTKYYFPAIQVKTVETEKEVIRTDVQTVVHTVTQPNGAIDTTTTTIDHSQKTETDNKTLVQLKSSTINVSALVGNDFSKRLIQPIYGISVSKELLGPITVGLFGLTSGTIGVSVGLNF